MKATLVAGDELIWHDVEHSSFGADLALFERMARGTEGPIADLGAGTGRVGLHLAGRGHRVVAIESDPRLAGELEARARRSGLPLEVRCIDARELELAEKPSLIIAPMQFLHILGGRRGRRRLLEAVARSLAEGGRFAASLLSEDLPEGSWRPDPIPDVKEVEGWVHSSLPTEIEVGDELITLRRLRSLVSPAGDLTEETYEISLDRLSVAELQREGLACGLVVRAIEAVPRSTDHEDSVIVTMTRGPVNVDG